jgi:hypothetical protein
MIKGVPTTAVIQSLVVCTSTTQSLAMTATPAPQRTFAQVALAWEVKPLTVTTEISVPMTAVIRFFNASTPTIRSAATTTTPAPSWTNARMGAV